MTAVHALGAKIVIVTAPISLTVGLAATAGVVIFFETGDFWKDLSLASVAAQVFWDTHQHGNETDADAETRQGLLDYAQFSFYQHTLQAADNVAADLGAIWNLGDRTPTQFYLSILARRDLALAPLTGGRWEPLKISKRSIPTGSDRAKRKKIRTSTRTPEDSGQIKRSCGCKTQSTAICKPTIWKVRQGCPRVISTPHILT